MRNYQSLVTPFEHQVEALKKLRTRGGGALLMEPGTGKTKVAVDFCGQLHLESNLERVLVIAPLSVLGVWEQEVERHLDPRIKRQIIRPAGHLRDRRKQLESLSPEGLTFLLVNYEAYWRLETLLLKKFAPECVIADESHKIKNGRAKQSRALHRLNQTKWKLILTGTPITKSPLDLFSQWKFLRPEVFGESWPQFAQRYAKYGGYKGYEVMGYKNLKHLRNRVARDAFIATKAECLDLPERLYQIVPVELEDHTRSLYESMEKDFCLTLGSEVFSAPIVLTKMLRLSQITGGFISDPQGIIRSVGSEKAAALAELLEDHCYAGQKVVVFARFRQELKDIMRVVRETLLKGVEISGEVPPVLRDERIRTFHGDPNLQVLVVQIATGGLGIDLTPASTAIFYNLDYSLGNYLQACDRLHRWGQTQKVLYLHLIAERTIDEVVYRALQNKEDLARLIIDYAKRRLA